MSSRWKARLRVAVGYVLAIVVGLLVHRLVVVFAIPGTPGNAKLRGMAPDCSWKRSLLMVRDYEWGAIHHAKVAASERLLRSDTTLGLEQYATLNGAFWLKREGNQLDGKSLLTYLITDHNWVVQTNPENVVHEGDTVIDCGAHVGVYTAKALALGAARVVSIEPDPGNLECLRRNLSAQIAAGRVIVVDQGVWSSEGKLVLHEAVDNSGMNSVVDRAGGTDVAISVTTIDALVRRLNLPRVDYIKFDIEGAEREALRGGMSTLRSFRPRLMLDANHRPDDMQVLPALIRQAHADYRYHCGVCGFVDKPTRKLVPREIFFE
ncbi:MAG: FkbM family methyltransferase [Acidobacteriales bacterium]|nr:FkbM family methyltransferase [Terriglobales bacterium]